VRFRAAGLLLLLCIGTRNASAQSKIARDWAKHPAIMQIDTGEDTLVREIAAWGEDPEERFSREELGDILDTAIQSLEPPYRSVFVLRDIDELSTEETAEALGLSVPAVKSRLLRARLQLREKLTRFFKRKGDDAFAYM